jgi:Domain of unknown function DUF29
VARADPVTKERPSLYERDFSLWLEQQAGLLRAGRLSELDFANLLEEIESMGRKDKNAIQSNLVVVLAHLLKYRFQQRSSSWRGSIVEHRRRLRYDLVESPSRGCAFCSSLCRRARAGGRGCRPGGGDLSRTMPLHSGAGARPAAPAGLSIAILNRAGARIMIGAAEPPRKRVTMHGRSVA